MNTLRSGAFLLGYHEKTAELGRDEIAREVYERRNSPWERMKSGINQFATNPEGGTQRQMAGTAGGAGVGAGLGYAMGGDLPSMLMGAGLGGFITYLAQEVFPNQTQQMWDWISKNFQQKTLGEAFDQVKQQYKEAGKYMPADFKDNIDLLEAQDDLRNAPDNSIAKAEAKAKVEALSSKFNKKSPVTVEDSQQEIPATLKRPEEQQPLPFLEHVEQSIPDFSKSLADATPAPSQAEVTPAPGVAAEGSPKPQ